MTIEWQESQFTTGNQIFGFWHEDSFFMNLVLEKLSGQTSPVDVIVTADTRGDYIEHMLQACGGHALRVPDGFAAFGALKKILQDSYESTRSIAVALDWHFIWRNRPRSLLWEFLFLIMDASGCSGDGTIMRSRFRFPGSVWQSMIMGK